MKKYIVVRSIKDVDILLAKASFDDYKEAIMFASLSKKSDSNFDYAVYVLDALITSNNQEK